VTGPGERSLLVAAQRGDEQAFARLVDPYRRELHLHCYRMLGGIEDADDALQETLVRAWRNLGRFEPRSPLRAWLYRIATNCCLTAVDRSRRQPTLVGDVVPPPPSPEAEEIDGLPLSPYPDTLLAGAPSTDPAAHYDLRESVQMAFLTAIQLLAPRQRAALLLRDVLAMSAAETAATLQTSVASVTSLLQRARASLDARARSGRLEPLAPAPADEIERDLLDRFMGAWETADIDRLVALMSEDALMTMPPFPLAYRGREAIAAFLSTVPAGGALDRISLVATRANGQPAVAAYGPADDGVQRPYGIMVLTLGGDSIARIDGFADAALFPHFGLPERRPSAG
jgi:RNA polymerase sigma-70 factor (TIGR02960 family)